MLSGATAKIAVHRWRENN